MSAKMSELASEWANSPKAIDRGEARETQKHILTHNGRCGNNPLCQLNHIHAEFMDKQTPMFTVLKRVNQKVDTAERVASADPKKCANNGRKLNRKRLKHTEASVLVAESQNQGFSPSTTLKEMDVLTGKQVLGGGVYINGSLSVITPKMDTGCCVIIATAPEDNSGNAHTKNSFTPGPWSADKWAPGYTVSAPEKHYSVCHLEDCNNSTANAHLIACAPELLEVLEHICKLLSVNHGRAVADVNTWAAKGREVIQKARGEA